MTTKRKIAVVELLLFIGILAWVFWPRSFEKAMDYDFSWDQVTQVTATMEAGGETAEVTLTPGEAEFEEFQAILDEQKFLIAGIGESGTERDNKLGCETTLFFDTEGTDYTVFFCGDQMMDFACTAAEKGRTLQSVEGLPFQERLLAFLLNVELSEEPAA